MPDQLAVTAGRLHRLVHLRQPLVVLLEGAQHRIRGKGFPDLVEHAVLGGEVVAHLVVGKALLRRHQTFVTLLVTINAGEKSQTFLHGFWQLFF